MKTRRCASPYGAAMTLSSHAGSMAVQEKLAASESELQHVRATAQAEFTRVQGEVAKAFKVGRAHRL